MRILKNPIFWEKRWNYFLPVFKAPHFLGVTFFWVFFCFSSFFLFVQHLARGCSKKPYFYGFFAHPSKASSASMQQQGSEAKTPQKKGAHFFFFFRKSLFRPSFFFKNTNFAPPPENCAPKNIQKRLFLPAQKKMARLLTLPWPGY